LEDNFVTNLSIRIHMFVVSAFQSVVDEMNRAKRGEGGQDLIEYAMLAGLIALALLGASIFFKNAVISLASGIGNCIDFNNSTPCKPGF
jgi:Flp pilus assembly pilin Flp